MSEDVGYIESDDPARRIFQPQLRGEIFDPWNGRDAIASGIIRAVGIAEDRFREDALRIMRGIRFDDPDGLLYFERVLDGSGVIDALRAAGCGEGDTVSIYDFEFDFID